MSGLTRIGGGRFFRMRGCCEWGGYPSVAAVQTPLTIRVISGKYDYGRVP